MRKLITGVLAAALTLGLLAVEPADAKVYKMKPEERAAALKEKRARKAHAKKSKKAAEDAPGGWVEVKGGSKSAVSHDKKVKKSKRDKAEERSDVVEKETKKSKKSKKDKAEKSEKISKSEKTSQHDTVSKSKKSKKAEKTTKMSRAERRKAKNRNVSTRDAFRDSERGTSVRASSAEVRRPAGSTAARPSGTQGHDLDAYSVSRPGMDKSQAGASGASPAPAATVPEVRHEVQPGPLDSSKPLGSQPTQGGEGRF